MKSFSQFSVAALASLATAASTDLNKRETPLSVELQASGNSQVNVTLVNKGGKALNLLSKGTFLDEKLPVEKVSIYSAGGSKQVPFEGIKVRLLTSGLRSDDFITLAAGEKKELTVETAALHTLNDGGDFDVFAKGFLPFAEAGSTELSGTLDYESNKLTMNVDGAQAAKVAKAIDLRKRTTVQSSCSGSQLSAVRDALSNCEKLATAAASATSGTKFTAYFKSASNADTVSARLKAVASDCGSTSRTTTTTTNCDDQFQGCLSNILGYTVPTTGYINYCTNFFSALPALASECHAQDQATTILHEETHANSVYSPGTEDLGYGYDAAIKLSASQALINADSYALFAGAVNLDC